MAKHVVARADEIPVGQRKVVTVRGRPIVIFNVAGDFFALYDRCPHAGGPLSSGKITGLAEADEPGRVRYTRRGEIVRCPWHGWEFDIKTGRSWCDPSRLRVRSYNTSVEPGTRLVEGPYVAETFEVSVEGEYVVVEV
jgi:3-phenylpropionate/trans-cinnamate dioxygenase ferredoxin subunit